MIYLDGVEVGALCSLDKCVHTKLGKAFLYGPGLCPNHEKQPKICVF